MGTEADLSGELLLTAWEGAGKLGLTISVYLTRNRFFFSRLVQRGSFRLALLHRHIHRVRKACLSRCALLENVTVTWTVFLRLVLASLHLSIRLAVVFGLCYHIRKRL